jgi:hypothetical protein
MNVRSVRRNGRLNNYGKPPVSAWRATGEMLFEGGEKQRLRAMARNLNSAQRSSRHVAAGSLWSAN